MKKLAKYLALPAMAVALYSSSAFGKLIEDGSAFTGQYIVQEQSCEKSVFSFVTGQIILVPNFSFEGTPEGLKVDGRLLRIQAGETLNHGQGVFSRSQGQYLSGNEFITSVFRVNPALNDGQMTTTVEYYYVGESVITKKTMTTIGAGVASVSGICHYLKSN